MHDRGKIFLGNLLPLLMSRLQIISIRDSMPPGAVTPLITTLCYFTLKASPYWILQAFLGHIPVCGHSLFD